MSKKINRIFDMVLSRYANEEYTPPKALIERPNSTIFPALQERAQESMNADAAMAYAQGPQQMPMMSDLLGQLGGGGEQMGMGGPMGGMGGAMGGGGGMGADPMMAMMGGMGGMEGEEPKR